MSLIVHYSVGYQKLKIPAKCRTPMRLLRTAGLAVAASAAFVFSAHSDAVADRVEQNRQAVLEFYELAINQKDFKAAEKFIGPHYIQHNPMAKDGKEGLKSFIEYLRAKQPDYHSEIVRSFADGDYVILHVRNTPAPGEPGNAIVDIFRLEAGKVVEHWDVVQAIPENPANDNTMF
jgi:predicted SnoaL-like aldol condensation-catalyzing enzyme